MHPMLTIAVRAARAAGEIIVQRMDFARDIAVQEKAHNDFVTDIDRRAEAAILNTLRQTFPGHRFLAEESGALGQGDEDSHQWIIDPLDGTTNYLHGFPQFAVSIAMRHRQRLELGLVYDPLRQELFTASRGSGAFLNNRRIRVSQRDTLHGALLGTGFPGRQIEYVQQYLRSLQLLIPHVAGIRRAGAAALDLAWLACGRLDGFWEYQLKPWDIAAGVLLIQEAGGLVCDSNGESDYMQSGDVVAGNPTLLKKILAILHEAGATGKPS